MSKENTFPKIGPSGLVLASPSSENQTPGFEETGLLDSTMFNVDPTKFDISNPVMGRYGEQGLRDQEYNSQSGAGLALKGIGNILTTGVGEAIKSIGYLGGGALDIGEGLLGGGFDLDITLNNMFNDGVSSLQETIKEDWIAVHKPSDFEDKSLGQQLIDPTFWATEGADGVGFLLSMLAPGQVLKAVNVGKYAVGSGKLMKGLGKAGIATDAGRVAGNVNSLAAVTANTFIEAAAEGTNMFDQTYKKGLASGLSDEEARLKAGENATKVFQGNLGILAVSNLIMERYVMGGFNRLRGKTGFGRINNEVIKSGTLAGRSAANVAGRYATGITGAALQEGAFEEGFQTALEQSISQGEGIFGLFEQYAENVNSLTGYGPATEDAKQFGRAVVLGGVLGGGMSAISETSDLSNEKRLLQGGPASGKLSTLKRFLNYKEKEQSEGLVSVLHNAYVKNGKDIKQMMEKDDNGDFTGLTKEAQENLTKGIGNDVVIHYYNDLLTKHNGDAKKAMSALDKSLKRYTNGEMGAKAFEQTLSDITQLTSGKEALLEMQAVMDMKYFAPFFAQEGGVTLLKEHIDSMLEVQAKRYEENTGVEMNPEQLQQVRQDMESKINTYHTAYQTANAEHNPYVLDLNAFKGIDTEDKAGRNDRKNKYNQFWSEVGQARQQAHIHNSHLEERVTELETEIAALQGTDEDGNEVVTDRRLLNKLQADLDIRKGKLKRNNENLALFNSKSKLQDYWDNKYLPGITNVNDLVEKANQEEDQRNELTAQNFFDELSKAGYELKFDTNSKGRITTNLKIGQKIHLSSGKKRVEVERMPDGTYDVIDGGERIKLSKEKGLSTVLSKYKTLRVVTVNELVEEKANQRMNEAMIEAKKQHAAQLQSINELGILKVNELEQARSKTKAIQDELNEVTDELNKLNEDLNKAKSRRKFFKINKSDIRKLIAKHEASIKSIEDRLYEARKEESALNNYLSHIVKWRNFVKKSKEIVNFKSLSSTFEQRKIELASMLDNPPINSDSMEEVEMHIATLANSINLLSKMRADNIDFVKGLRKLLDENNIIESWIKNIGSAAWVRSKYSYNIADGVKEISTDPKVIELFLENNPRVRDNFYKQAAEFMLANDLDFDDMIQMIKEDGRNIDIKSYSPTDAKKAILNEFMLMTVDKHNELTSLIEPQKAALEYYKNERGHMLYMQSREQLNKLFKQALEKMHTEEITSEQVMDSIEPPVNPDNVSGMLPTTMMHTTGLSIAYDKKGDMLIDGVPKGALTDSQQAWFNFTDKLSKEETKNYYLELRVADYNDDSDINVAFAKNNTTARGDQDIFAVVIDSVTGNPLKINKKGNVDSNGIIAFTSIRRPDTMFPIGGQPKMAMTSLYEQMINEVLNGLSISKDYFSKNMSAKIGNKIKNTNRLSMLEKALFVEDIANKTFKEIESDVVRWGRRKYDEMIQPIITNKVMYANISDISNGHIVTIKDKDGNNIMSSPTTVFKDKLDQGYEFNIARGDGEVRFSSPKSGFVAGSPVMKLNSTGQTIPLHTRNLNSNEVDMIISLLAKVSEKDSGDISMSEFDSNLETFWKADDKNSYGKDKKVLPIFPSRGSKLNLLSLFMNYGVKRTRNDNNKNVPAPGVHSFWLTKDKSMVMFGKTGKMRLQDAINPDTNQPLREFLATKKMHVNKKLLSRNYKNGDKKRPYSHPVRIEGNKIIFKKYASYNDFLFSKDGGLKTTAVHPSTLSSKGLPQMAQRNLTIGTLSTEAPQLKKAPVEEQKSEPETSETKAAPSKEVSKAVTKDSADIAREINDVYRKVAPKFSRYLIALTDMNNRFDIRSIIDKGKLHDKWSPTNSPEKELFKMGLDTYYKQRKLYELMNSFGKSILDSSPADPDKLNYIEIAETPIIKEPVTKEEAAPIVPEDTSGANPALLAAIQDVNKEAPKKKKRKLIEPNFGDSSLDFERTIPKDNNTADMKLSPSKILREMIKSDRIQQNCD